MSENKSHMQPVTGKVVSVGIHAESNVIQKPTEYKCDDYDRNQTKDLLFDDFSTPEPFAVIGRIFRRKTGSFSSFQSNNYGRVQDHNR